MPRMISENEKRAKRRKQVRHDRVARLVARGWKLEDASKVVGALRSAQDLAELGKLSRQLGCAGEARTFELQALDSLEVALKIAKNYTTNYTYRGKRLQDEDILGILERKRAAYGAPTKGGTP